MAILEEFGRIGITGRAVLKKTPQRVLAGELERGNCFVFLDDIDEVPQEHFGQVITLIREFQVMYDSNYFLTTISSECGKPQLFSDSVVFRLHWSEEKIYQLLMRALSGHPGATARDIHGLA